MGVDKARLEIGGRSLLDRAVASMRQLLADVYVSVNRRQVADLARNAYPLLIDQHEDIGPAAGLHAAHDAFPDSAWLVLACDMPLVDVSVLAMLVAARDPACDATALAASSGKRAEPLCAIYEPATLAAFHEQLSTGEPCGPSAWLARSSVRLCEVPKDRLVSVNTQEQWTSIRERLV